MNVPLLIIHGAGDEEVPVTQALEFARRLGDLGKTYLLVIYAGGNHEVATRRKERDREIISWFKSHLRNRDPRVILA